MLPTEFEAIPNSARLELENLDSQLDGVIASWAKELEAVPLPYRLYHYTNEAGLKGILQSGHLWMTDVFDFNDPSELKHGVSIAARLLKDRAKLGSPKMRDFSAHFEQFSERGVEQSAHYFACCFSTREDDLGQWRAYADNGRGYVLEFETALLEGAFSKLNMSSFPITYDDPRLSTLHGEMVKRVEPLISLEADVHMTPSQLSEYRHALSALFSMHVVRAALFFKHQAYARG